MEDDKLESICTFCGRHYTEDDRTILFSSGDPDVFICYDCAKEIYQLTA